MSAEAPDVCLGQLCFSVSAVIIQSLKDTPVLTDESILFRSDRLALAKVG